MLLLVVDAGVGACCIVGIAVTDTATIANRCHIATTIKIPSLLPPHIRRHHSAQAHIEDQIEVFVDKHKQLLQKKRQTVLKLQEANDVGKDVTAQHLTAEVCYRSWRIRDVLIIMGTRS